LKSDRVTWLIFFQDGRRRHLGFEFTLPVSFLNIKDLPPAAVFQVWLKSLKPFTSYSRNCDFKMAAVAILDLGVSLQVLMFSSTGYS
jgi:hypothetical protein